MIHMQRADQTVQELSAHRARLCMLALQKLQDQWPVASWTLHLFERIVGSIGNPPLNAKTCDCVNEKRLASQHAPEQSQQNGNALFESAENRQAQQVNFQEVQQAELGENLQGLSSAAYDHSLMAGTLMDNTAMSGSSIQTQHNIDFAPNGDLIQTFPFLGEIFNWGYTSGNTLF